MESIKLASKYCNLFDYNYLSKFIQTIILKFLFSQYVTAMKENSKDKIKGFNLKLF